jgi:hypothetical protein
MAFDSEEKQPQTADEALLQEIRDRFKYGMDAWREIREERQTDMRYICGDPWEPADRKDREDAGRPCISHDEIGQYVNQGVNNLRQSKRGIKVEPRSSESNDQTAELRQDKVRTIQYRSKSQDVYLRAAQDMYEGSYGFFRIARKFVLDDPADDDPHAFDQEILIKPIPNPDSVIYDPDCKEADWSDAQWCFVVEPMAKEEFKRRYPDAQKKDFSADDLRVAKDWLQDKQVLVAEYWKVEVSEVRTIERDGLKRRVEKKRLRQYVTNGVEILEKSDQPGKEIPIPAMIGLERYLDEGGGPKRKLFSLPRLARDPQMSLAYLVTLEAEEAGQTPKTPYLGYRGQFETDADAWETLNKVPRSFIQVDPVIDETNRSVLPLPRREQFVPNFGAYEVAKDSARRAIQAAMGISPLPTAAQRNNEKSGVALEKIQNSEAVGSLHFSAGYDRAITRAGRIIDSWIPVVYDTEREEWLHKADDTRRRVRLNTEEPYVNPETGQSEHYPIGDEEHDVTVSAAPDYDSQRQAVSDFLDNLIANLGKLPIPPPAAAKLFSLAIKMKELGPKGDEMAEIISPEQGDQSQQLQGMQQQMQQQGQILQAMQAELQKLQLEKAGKVIENQGKMALEDKKLENDLAKAEITTKAQSAEERLKFVEDMWRQLHSQAHDAGTQAADQAHERQQAEQQAAVQQEQQQQQQQQQQTATDQPVQQ